MQKNYVQEILSIIHSGLPKAELAEKLSDYHEKDLADALEAYNEGRMEPVVLTETDQSFLTAAKSAVGLSADEAWQVLNALAAPAE